MENNDTKREQEERAKKIISEYGKVSKEFLEKVEKIKSKDDEEER